jgi:hypothetical protein
MANATAPRKSAADGGGTLPAQPTNGDTTSSPAPSDTLQSFTLDDLAQYTCEGTFGPTASPDFRVFYVGRDNVHGVLVHLFSRVRLSVKMNMFGYDDDQLNQILIGLVQDPRVMVQVTLDKSQSTGVHEKAILQSDVAKDPEGYAADFAVGQSDTHQISHTKGGVLDGIVAFEGSTNWSASGEGTGIVLDQAKQGPGFKAQNNTTLGVCQYVRDREILRPVGLRTRRRITSDAGRSREVLSGPWNRSNEIYCGTACCAIQGEGSE